jgi:surface polysaccharide O-acyltransferase-like enzyme
MRDSRFDVLRIVACLAVILLHVSARPLYLHIQGGASHFWWLTGAAISALTHWCVPVFVMLSGALLLGKEVSWKMVYLRRMPRIAIVLACSAAIYALWRVYFIKDFTVQSFVSDLLQGQPYYHLYFFYVIIGIYAISPLVSRALDELNPETFGWITVAASVIACMLLTFGVWRGNYSRDAMSFPWDYIGYFMLGAYMARYRPQAPYGLVVVASYVASLVWMELAALTLGPGSPWAMYAFLYFSPFVFAFSIGVFGLLIIQWEPKQALDLAWLSSLTLIVYIIHPMVMEFLRWNYLTKVPQLSRLVFDLPVTFAVTALISFGLAWLIYRIPGVRRLF